MNLLNSEESFKINEFQYEIYCGMCEKNLSNKNDQSIHWRQDIIELVEQALKAKKTVTFEMDFTKQNLLNFLSNSYKDNKKYKNNNLEIFLQRL